MNCQSCNTRIDYRFLTTCAHCGSKVEGASLTPNPPPPDPPSMKSGLTWKQGLINVAYVFASAVTGMISGAVVIYFAGAMVYLTFFSGGGGNPSEQCARGTAAAVLSILLGAFLGTMGGSVFAVKKPLCKGATK
jgi:hypothetical protein